MIKQTIAALLLMTGAASALPGSQVEINPGGIVEITSATNINTFRGYAAGCDIRFSNGEGLRSEGYCQDRTWGEIVSQSQGAGRTTQLLSTGNVEPSSTLDAPVLTAPVPNTTRIIQVFSWDLTVDGIRLRLVGPRVDRIVTEEGGVQTGISHVGTDQVWEDNERTAVRQDIIDNHFNQCQAPRG